MSVACITVLQTVNVGKHGAFKIPLEILSVSGTRRLSRRLANYRAIALKEASMGVAIVEETDVSAAPVAEKSIESSVSAVEWASIFGGALAAFGVTAILLTLGPGLGLTTVSPWSFSNPSPTAFGTAAAIWLVVTQWLSSAFGGYLTGRLRTKWVGIRTDEVLFRDTAHGLLAWALATLLMAALLTIGSGVTAGVAAAAASSTPATPPSPEAAEQARKIAVAFSFTTSLSLLIGALMGAAAGALGGFHRDEA
jgi:hypothetical protein